MRGFSQVTTGGNVGNLLGNLLSGAAAESGGGALVPTGSALTAGAAAEADAAAAGLGAGALGNPLTWGAAAAFAAGAAVACLTVGQDICMNPPEGGQSIWHFLPAFPVGYPSSTNIPYGTGLWAAQWGNGQIAVGPDPTLLPGQAFYNYFNGRGAAKSQASCTGGSYNTAGNLFTQSCSITLNSYPGSDTENVSAGTTTSYTVPAGGINCGSKVFNVTQTGDISCSEAVNPITTTVTNPAQITPNMFTPNQLNEPANPTTIAGLANGINQQIGAQTGTMPYSGTITATQVTQMEQQTGNYPNLNDLLQPIASGDLITTNSSGQQVNTNYPTISSSLPTTTTAQQQQQNNAPCGNLLAGETDCGMTLDMHWNPETGCWEYMGATDLVRSSDGCSETPGQSVSPYVQTLQDITTQLLKDATTMTDTATKTVTTTANPTTSPTAQLQQLQKTQDATLTKTGEDIAMPHPPPNVPVIQLPFDEWPQVFQDFSTDAPSFSGQCPTVTFKIALLNNTTFHFAVQCLIMDGLKPYMQYVLPPTYLLMALLWIMAA